MLKEFKEFATRGNIIDMAVGVVIGGAFQKIINSLVADIIMPAISIITGKVDFSDMVFTAMPTGTLKLFTGINTDTGALSAPSYARISNVKIKRNGETIRNFRACQRTADGELGMRDSVTGEFYTNAGTGVFEYLPDDVVESGTVVKKPTLTMEQKEALQALMDDYYNNKSTFFYEFTHNRNAFTSGG